MDIGVRPQGVHGCRYQSTDVSCVQVSVHIVSMGSGGQETEA